MTRRLNQFLQQKLGDSLDSHSKSLAKAFSWRIIATVTTGLIGLLITGSVKVASAIMTFDFVLKLLLYYLHERIWNNVQ